VAIEKLVSNAIFSGSSKPLAKNEMQLTRGGGGFCVGEAYVVVFPLDGFVGIFLILKTVATLVATPGSVSWSCLFDHLN
jgi:hypothetical protein